MISLILGGEKSGKSAYALDRLMAVPGPRLMLATGQARDLGFRRQILDHRAARPAEIPVAETGPDLATDLEGAARSHRAILVDSLDFWLYGRVLDGDADKAVPDLLDALGGLDGSDVLLVSCEAGLGPIAANAETRAFVRRLGAMNQALAGVCGQVVLVVAGRPLILPAPQA